MFGSGLNDISDAFGMARVGILAGYVQGDPSTHHVNDSSNAFDAFLEGIGNVNLRNNLPEPRDRKAEHGLKVVSCSHCRLDWMVVF